MPIKISPLYYIFAKFTFALEHFVGGYLKDGVVDKYF